MHKLATTLVGTCVVLGLQALTGCAYGPPIRITPGPRIAGVSTPDAVVGALAELGFIISAVDAPSGLVSAQRDSRELPFGNVHVLVRDQVQAVLGAGGVLVTSQAECRFATTDWGPCRDIEGQTRLQETIAGEYREVYDHVAAAGVTRP